MGEFPTSLIRQIRDTIDDGTDARIENLHLSGPRVTFASAFDVTGLAVGATALALLAAADLLAVRRHEDPAPDVHIDSREASAAFASERLFTPIGWQRPPLWDPIAGTYRTADGWIRLHTNYPRHREVVEAMLDAHDRAAVQARVATLRAEDLEEAVVAAGGAAAALRTREQWLATPAGVATASAPAVSTTWFPAPDPVDWRGTPERPFDGVRVLDLTRVIAGPVSTSFLAGYGADVLRIDPPGFPEVPSLLPVTTMGKRTAELDLTDATARATFDALLRDADVVVCGLRADALGRLGYDYRRLRSMNPNLIVADLNAYGWAGPWRDRRGFDSLVQVSSGLAATGSPENTPVALPVQALDHATGWLLGAAIARALTARLTEHRTATIQASLIGTANLLWSLPVPSEPPESDSVDDAPLVDRSTEWGPARAVGPAGHLRGVAQVWKHPAGPLGRHEAQW